MRTTIFLALLAVSSAPFAVVACGGSTPPAQTGGTGGDSDGGGGSTSTTTPSGAHPMDDGGATTTTTTTLSDAGDLQGMKLTSSTTHHVEAPKTDGGAAGPHTPDPGRAPKDIQTIILARRDEARACYDKELKKNPNISEGDLIIEWVIDPKGNPNDIKVNTAKSQISEQAVTTCIIDIIKKIKFSESPRGFQTTTNYPLQLQAGERGEGRSALTTTSAIQP